MSPLQREELPTSFTQMGIHGMGPRYTHQAGAIFRCLSVSSLPPSLPRLAPAVPCLSNLHPASSDCCPQRSDARRPARLQQPAQMTILVWTVAFVECWKMTAPRLQGDDSLSKPANPHRIHRARRCFGSPPPVPSGPQGVTYVAGLG